MALPVNFTGKWTEFIPGSPRESFEVDGSKAERIIDIADWSQRAKYIGWILGYPARAATGILTRIMPDFHPDFICANTGDPNEVDEPYLYATRVLDCQGISFDERNDSPIAGEGTPISKYKKARLRVQYEALPYAVKDDAFARKAGTELCRFVTRLVDPEADQYSLTPGSFAFDDSAYPKHQIAAAIPFMFSAARLTYIWHQIPAYDIPMQTILDTIGKVNVAEFDASYNIYGRGPWAAGTLLCLPPRFTPRRSPNGIRMVDIEYNFHYRKQGHNKFWNPAIGDFLRIWRVADSSLEENLRKSQYETTNFNNLFLVA